MEITLGNVIAGFAALISAAGFGWGLVKWVQAQIREARTDAQKETSDLRAQHASELGRLDGRIESIRAECVRRDELHNISDMLKSLGDRFDRGMEGVHQRIDKMLHRAAE